MEFMKENDLIFGKKVVVDAGDSTTLKAGQIISARKLRDENSCLKEMMINLLNLEKLYQLRQTHFFKV